MTTTTQDEDTKKVLWSGSPQRVKTGPLLFALSFSILCSTFLVFPLVHFLRTGQVSAWISVKINGTPLESSTEPQIVFFALVGTTIILALIWIGAALYTLHKRSELYELHENTAVISWTFPFKGYRAISLNELHDLRSTWHFRYQSLSFRTSKANVLNRIYRIGFIEFSNLKNAEAAEQHLMSKMNESFAK